MGRKLPNYDPETDGPWETSKRRQQLLKRIYQSYFQWKALREAGKVDDVLTIEGDDYYLGDLLVGLETLPRQQRRAFELICLHGYTESAATAIILPGSNWSTPVQQYSDDGLKKMIAAYDAKQAGIWDPRAVKKRRTRKEEMTITVKTNENGHSGTTIKYDWNVHNEDDQSLADYINAETGLGISPLHVKAVTYLRKAWYNSAAEAAKRERRKAEREAEKAKYAYETPEQRKARLRANQVLKKHDRAMEGIKQMEEEVRQLRIDAGLDPDTGDPVPAAVLSAAVAQSS